MFTYQRCHHSNGDVGVFGVIGVCREFSELLEVGMGKGKAASHGIILSPPQSPHHLNSNHHFIQYIKEVKLEPGKVMKSYDAKTLLT